MLITYNIQSNQTILQDTRSNPEDNLYQKRPLKVNLLKMQTTYDSDFIHSQQGIKALIGKLYWGKYFLILNKNIESVIGSNHNHEGII